MSIMRLTRKRAIKAFQKQPNNQWNQPTINNYFPPPSNQSNKQMNDIASALHQSMTINELEPAKQLPFNICLVCFCYHNMCHIVEYAFSFCLKRGVLVVDVLSEKIKMKSKYIHYATPTRIVLAVIVYEWPNMCKHYSTYISRKEVIRFRIMRNCVKRNC